MLDLIGKKFGRLTVLHKEGRTTYGNITWMCKCECGNHKVVAGGNLQWGSTVSCGCYISQKLKEKHTTHGMKGTRPYNIYQTMISRCHNPNAKNYYNYGGRGITVCNCWKESFINFWNDMGGSYFEGGTIDRIDTSEGYSLSNCRWVTAKEQSRNRRNNIIITYNGESLCLMDWSIKLGINYQKLLYRIKSGWDTEKAFITK